MKKIVTIAVLNIIMIIGPIWWWAIVGMSSNVGTAWVLTDALVFMMSLGAIAAIIEKDKLL